MMKWEIYMNKIKINSPLTNETIQRINGMAQRENVIIVFNNTIIVFFYAIKISI